MADSLPKFLFCDDGADRTFVLHCHWPRMLIEFADGAGSVVMKIDPGPEVIKLELEAGREPSLLIARIMREAGEFYIEQIYDEE